MHKLTGWELRPDKLETRSNLLQQGWLTIWTSHYWKQWIYNFFCCKFRKNIFLAQKLTAQGHGATQGSNRWKHIASAAAGWAGDLIWLSLEWVDKYLTWWLQQIEFWRRESDLWDNFYLMMAFKLCLLKWSGILESYLWTQKKFLCYSSRNAIGSKWNSCSAPAEGSVNWSEYNFFSLLHSDLLWQE